MHTPPLDLFAWSLFAAVLGVAAVIDVRARRIPNALVAPLLVAGLGHAALVGGAATALASLVGAAAGLALLYFPFARGWMGGGDVKLLAAIGAWVGGVGAIHVLLLASIFGGVLSLIALARLQRRERDEVGRNVMRFAVTGGVVVPEPSQLSRARGVPFGVALALAGAAVTFPGIL